MSAKNILHNAIYAARLIIRYILYIDHFFKAYRTMSEFIFCFDRCDLSVSRDSSAETIFSSLGILDFTTTYNVETRKIQFAQKNNVISTILFSFFLSLTFYLYFSLCLPFTLFLKQYNIEFIYCTYIDDIFLEKNSFKRIRELSFLLFCFFFNFLFLFFFFLCIYILRCWYFKWLLYKQLLIDIKDRFKRRYTYNVHCKYWCNSKT